MSHLDIFYYPVLGAGIQSGFLSYWVDLDPTFDPLGFYCIKIVVSNNNINSIRNNVLRGILWKLLYFHSLVVEKI